MNILQEKDGAFSWRKGLTALTGSMFVLACIVFWFGGKELPVSYQAIIAGTFAFYFVKDKLRKE
jgi:hypothetical protein